MNETRASLAETSKTGNEKWGQIYYFGSTKFAVNVSSSKPGTAWWRTGSNYMVI